MFTFAEHHNAIEVEIKRSNLSRLTYYGHVGPTVWLSDFGDFRIESSGKLIKYLKEKPKIAGRYLRAVDSYCRNRWVEGESGPWSSPAEWWRITQARLKLRAARP